jgi:hypothetical protein
MNRFFLRNIGFAFLKVCTSTTSTGTTFDKTTFPSGAFATDTPLHQHQGLYLMKDNFVCIFFSFAICKK